MHSRNRTFLITELPYQSLKNSDSVEFTFIIEAQAPKYPESPYMVRMVSPAGEVTIEKVDLNKGIYGMAPLIGNLRKIGTFDEGKLYQVIGNLQKQALPVAVPGQDAPHPKSSNQWRSDSLRALNELNWFTVIPDHKQM